MSNIVTYKIVSDKRNRLKAASKIACNFWNRFVEPKRNVVIRAKATHRMLGVATSSKPWSKNGTDYCLIRFNKRKLKKFTPIQAAGTMVHEIGHTLGFGWDAWNALYDKQTGKFTPEAVTQLSSLAEMEVEREHGPGTEFSHWDEDFFASELMTGFKNSAEHVLPVTIDVMSLLGHTVKERLTESRSLPTLLQETGDQPFSRQDLVERIDLDHFEKTEIFERIPHN